MDPVPVNLSGTSFSGVRSYHEAVVWILKNESETLSETERDFLENMRPKLVRQTPTEKQGKWICNILDRCGGYWS